MTRTSILVVISIFFTFFIISCSGPESDWQKAKQQNTIEAYTTFIKLYPQSNYLQEAKSKIEDLDWANSVKAHTLKGYQEFIRLYPESNHVNEAKSKVEDLDWANTAKTNTTQVYQEFFKKYPEPSLLHQSWSPVLIDKTISIDKIAFRSWEKYDGMRPDIDTKVRWQVGEEAVPSDVFESGWLIRSVKILVLDNIAKTLEYGGLAAEKGGKPIYSMEIKAFATVKDAPVEKASGVFWEATLFLKNTANEPGTFWLHRDDEHGLDISLITSGERETKLKAFLLPNMPLNKKSLVTDWTGKLGVTLNPGETTWVVLVFDVPKETNFGILKFQAAPIMIGSHLMK